MKSIKQYFGYILAFLTTIIGFLVFFITRKNKEIDELEAEVGLSVQSEKSRQVDKEVGSAQKEIDIISQEINKPVSKDQSESDKFWDDYKDKK